MLGWFQALLPRDERFFELFAQHSLTVLAGAEALRTMIEQGGDAVPGQCQVIMDREQEADRITREVLIAVRRTFITPFDRGDIKDLITSMDDTIDEMQATAKAITLYEMTSFTPQMQAMADAIVKSATLVGEAMPLFRSISVEAARLGSIAEQITQLEGQADEIYDTGRKELYRQHGTSNPMAYVVGNEVYDHLEAVIDRFDDVANEINSVVIDHV
jgi:predicted phosphate transport protein (TIGR00153 family)